MKNRIFTLLIVLFATMLCTQASDALTSLKITISENGGTPHTETLPASGMPVIDLTNEMMTSLAINGAEVSTTGTVKSVQVLGSVYKQGNTPSEWRGIPLQNKGNGIWGISGISADLIDEEMGSSPRVFEFYVSATDANNNPIYFNNGGQNYKIIFKPSTGGGGGDENWKVKFYSENTASITLNFNNNDQSYSYSGNGQRDPGTSQQPGGVSSLTIKGFDISFLRNVDMKVEISDVSLQYKVYEDGGYGEWNRIDVTNTQSGSVYNKDKDVWEYWMRCEATNLKIDVTSALKSGKNYNLEIMYQIVTYDGDYIMFLQNKETNVFKFSMSTSGVGSLKADGKKKAVRYDLNGRKLNSKPTSGLYIEDGKIYLAQ